MWIERKSWIMSTVDYIMALLERRDLSSSSIYLKAFYSGQDLFTSNEIELFFWSVVNHSTSHVYWRIFITVCNCQYSKLRRKLQLRTGLPICRHTTIYIDCYYSQLLLLVSGTKHRYDLTSETIEPPSLSVDVNETLVNHVRDKREEPPQNTRGRLLWCSNCKGG